MRGCGPLTLIAHRSLLIADREPGGTMIDPGHPFSIRYEDLIASLEDRIRNGVEQPDRARPVFQRAVSTYELPRTAYAITRVSGLLGGHFTIFQPGRHYQFSNNRVIWIDADHRPDENSRL